MVMLVVAHDVADDRGRARPHTLLLGYGQPIQESVFKCVLTARQEAAMKRGVARIVRAGLDKVRYYHLCERCAGAWEDLNGPCTDLSAAVLI
jgi:CRISPR-associated endonuclease Cas2